MQLESTFSVVAPIDTVWATIMDFERVAGCVPGAEILNKLSEDAYQVGMKVKLGPVSMQYKGLMNVIERDAVAHRAVFEGRAQEARGQGTAQGTATLSLSESGGTTTGTVSADIALSGKVAAMGKSIIGSVTDQMMALFAENLQAMVGETSAAPPAAEGAVPSVSPGAPSGQAAPAGQPAAGQPTPRPTARPAAPAGGTSLNAMALAKGMVMDQLSSPAKLLALVAAVACVAYRLGRRGSRRKCAR